MRVLLLGAKEMKTWQKDSPPFKKETISKKMDGHLFWITEEDRIHSE